MDAKDLVVWALEASMYFEPRKPGLTVPELGEIGAHFGVAPGSIELQLRGRPLEGGRVVPFGVDPSFFASFDGDLRSVKAFDHVMAGLKAVAEAAGQRPPIADRETLIAAGTAAGLPREDVELAVATYRAFEGVPEADARWEIRRIKPTSPMPSVQREGPMRKVTRRERFSEIVEHVRTVTQRRRGGAPAPRAAIPPAPRPPSALGPSTQPSSVVPPGPHRSSSSTIAAVSDSMAPKPAWSVPPPSEGTDAAPIASFRATLAALGQARLVAWWTQMTHDLSIAERHGASLTKCVLAATMTELVLTTALPKPRDLKPDAKGRPARWGFLEMARASGSIGVDPTLRARIESLYKFKQRVQVPKLVEQSGALLDLSAEEAREAGDTLNAVLRIAIPWHQRGGFR